MDVKIVVAGDCLLCGKPIVDGANIFFCEPCKKIMATRKIEGERRFLFQQRGADNGSYNSRYEYN